MNKNELRDGDRITLRNGHKFIMFGNTFGFGFILYEIEDYNNDLTNNEDKNEDIIQVERVQFPRNVSVTSIEDIDRHLTYQTIWEREETKENKCIKCGEKVGNDVFTYCEKCWKIIYPTEQPKKIEPFDLQKFAEEEDDRKIMWTFFEKINEIVEVINNGKHN